MGFEALFTTGVIGVLLGLLIFTQIGPDLILISGVTVLLLCGILDPGQALKGMSNPGMITVGVLYIVVTGLRETGSINYAVTLFFGKPKTLLGAQLRMMPSVSVMSAFLNNTPVVAMLIPAVKEWAKPRKFSMSHLMIPLSYASILGGTCTLIGTSTNLVIAGMVAEHCLINPDEKMMQTIGMFDITWVGLPVLVIGTLYMLLVGRKLLPDRQPVLSDFKDPREYTVEMVVDENGPLVGKTIEEASLRKLSGMFLADIYRGNRFIPAVSPHEQLEANDQLVFVGIVESVVDLQNIRGLKLATDQVFKLDVPRSERCLIESVVSSSSHLIGKTIRDGRFRTTYNAVVISVARNGMRIHKKIGDIVLQPGDNLLLEAHPSFLEQHKNSRDFLLISRVENSSPLRHDKAMLSLAILALMVLLAGTGLMSMLQSAMLAAGLMIITRCCSSAAARDNVDWQVLLVIAASFGLGAALESTGAAKAISDSMILLAGDNPIVSLMVIYLITTMFTEMITNNAAAVLVFPIAHQTALSLGVDNFMPFAITIMMAASASFVTPIGYQTNLMVYGPGGYRFTDYARVGLPLNILVAITTVTICSLMWL